MNAINKIGLFTIAMLLISSNVMNGDNFLVTKDSSKAKKGQICQGKASNCNNFNNCTGDAGDLGCSQFNVKEKNGKLKTAYKCDNGLCVVK